MMSMWPRVRSFLAATGSSGWKTVAKGSSATVVALVSGGFAFRQYHLRQSVICESAVEQLKSADAVVRLLGGQIVSTRGVIGGYMDPLNGTAVLTIPLLSESGAQGIARVEAEAEWVGQPDEEILAQMRRGVSNARWQFRHLEVELQPTVQAVAVEPDSFLGAEAGPLVLYSVPQRLPLSPWNPPRTGRLPRWVRDLFPTHGLGQDDSSLKLIQASGAMLVIHIVAFFYLRHQMLTSQRAKAAQVHLLLKESTTLRKLCERAASIAINEQAGGTTTPLSLITTNARYGVVGKSDLVAFTTASSEEHLVLLFAAERDSGSQQWKLTHVSLQEAGRKEKVLSAATDKDSAHSMVTRMVTDFTSVNLPTPEDEERALRRGRPS